MLTKDLDRLFDVFEIPATEHDDWRWLADSAAGGGWWDDYDEADLPASPRLYVNFEWGCRRLHIYTGGFLHGLLQTPGYADARIRSGLVQRSSHQIARMVEILERRKAVLDPPDPMALHLIFDESVLHRSAGTNIMVAQLAHLLDLAESHPNVTLQAMPYSTGLYPALAGSFALMDFGFADDAGVVNLEPALVDSVYVEDAQQVYLHIQMFENMAETRAADPQDTLAMLRQALTTARSRE